MEVKNCATCNKPIDPRRVKALPHTKVCKLCSKEEKIACYLIINGKTGNELGFCSQETSALIEKKQQRYGQSPSQGMKC